MVRRDYRQLDFPVAGKGEAVGSHFWRDGFRKREFAKAVGFDHEAGGACSQPLFLQVESYEQRQGRFACNAHFLFFAGLGGAQRKAGFGSFNAPQFVESLLLDVGFDLQGHALFLEKPADVEHENRVAFDRLAQVLRTQGEWQSALLEADVELEVFPFPCFQHRRCRRGREERRGFLFHRPYFELGVRRVVERLYYCAFDSHFVFQEVFQVERY